MPRVSTVALAAFVVASGCNDPSSGPPPTMSGRGGLLAKTSVAQKCEEAAKGHDRPFVVEWDATDLATFEARAARDTLVVKYQGCSLDLLDGCSDPSFGGRFGAYGTPQLTSGTMQGFDIANQGELVAKLPLGFAAFSAKVEAGESLHLKYFVTGVATSSRDRIYRNDLAPFPGCQGATHFVWAYNLGAFELASNEKSSAGGGIGVGVASAGGARNHSEAQLANGGNLPSCTTNDQRGCRVPIRLVLRPIAEGAAAAGQQAYVMGGAKVMPDAPISFDQTPMGQANAMVKEAEKRHHAGDGPGCVELLEKAVTLDPKLFVAESHAECLMQAGKCDAGKAELRQVYGQRDAERKMTDANLDDAVARQANATCPASTATNDADYIARASRELYSARQQKDGARCRSLFEGIEQRATRAPKTKDGAHEGWGQAAAALDQASFCIGESRSCTEGLGFYKRSWRLRPMSARAADQNATTTWPQYIQSGMVKCAAP